MLQNPALAWAALEPMSGENPPPPLQSSALPPFPQLGKRAVFHIEHIGNGREFIENPLSFPSRPLPPSSFVRRAQRQKCGLSTLGQMGMHFPEGDSGFE